MHKKKTHKPNPQTDWGAKAGSGNTLDENKTFGIFFQSNSKTAPS